MYLIEKNNGQEEGETAIAEYDYEVQEENELSFPERGITNIERVFGGLVNIKGIQDCFHDFSSHLPLFFLSTLGLC
jgi:hypothetical protein